MLYGARDFALGSKQELHWRRRMGPNFLHPLLPHVDMPELLLFGAFYLPPFPSFCLGTKSNKCLSKRDGTARSRERLYTFCSFPTSSFPFFLTPPPLFPLPLFSTSLLHFVMQITPIASSHLGFSAAAAAAAASNEEIEQFLRRPPSSSSPFARRIKWFYDEGAMK